MRIRVLVMTLGVAGALMIGAALMTDCNREAEGPEEHYKSAVIARHQGYYPIMRRSPAVRMIIRQDVVVLPDHLKALLKRLGNG